MDKRIQTLLLLAASFNTLEYDGEVINDSLVNECLMDMYFYMMYCGVDKLKEEDFYQKFKEKYNALNDEQQRIVKQEYINIIETQNKNKEKIKKKGMNNYE